MSEYEAESVTRVVGRSEVCCSSKPSRMTKKPMLPAEV